MILDGTQLSELSEVAIEAALKTGKFIESKVNSGIEAQTKDGGESLASQVVTEVDFKSQEIILSYLEPKLKPFNLGLLTEEKEDDNSRFEKDYFWCIDPLDGTLPFVEGTSGYAVSISLIAKDGIPHIGVIYDPRNQILYHAIMNQGAFRNKLPWKFKASKETFTFLANRSMMDNLKYPDILRSMEELGESLGLKIFKHIIQAGAALNAMWAIENAPAGYFALPKKADGGGSLWDYSASACIYKELGVSASDVYGNPLDLNRPDSCFLNHRGIMYASDLQLAPKLIKLIEKFL